ncbi:DUF4402 domain-containing protein [Fusobacterium sp.]|uniref:DUF4402 domain-containing protein n=1 Tax=Fusobacterium sp. TaxID=68766 RepID=UPI00396D019A
MKKTMLVLCFMAMALTTVANEQSAVEGEVRVTAEVIQKLDVKTDPVNFGKVAQGSKNNTPIEKGTVTITGHENEKLKIQFASGTQKEWKDNLSQVKVELSKGAEETKLTYLPNLDPELVQPLALENGKKVLGLSGTLEVPENATPGQYEGTLNVKVWYE